jgi:protein O-mannosyl-transferase
MQRRTIAPASRLAQSQSAAPNRHRGGARLLCGVLLVVGTLAVYSQVRGHAFINVDDPIYASGNPYIQGGLSLEGVRWSLGTHDCNWIPLTWLSLMLDSTLFGTGPAGYHVTNVILHAANAVLLFLALAAATGNTPRSAFVAALFALHPLHVESVAWVAERKDVLSIFFGLLSLQSYVRYAQAGKAWRLAIAFLFFVCSLLSKSTLVTLPFVFLLLDYWPLARLAPAAEPTPIERSAERKRRSPAERGDSGSRTRSPIASRLLEKVPFFVAAATFSAIALFAQSQGGAMTATHPFATRLLNAIYVYVAYLEKAAYPFNLAVYYPYLAYTMSWLSVAVAALVLLAISATAVMFVRRYPFLFVGWFWYLGTLVPMIGIVQIGTQQMADRYTYFPLSGVFLAVVWLAPELAPAGFLRQRVLPLAGVVWLALLAAITFGQVGYWQDSVTLLRHAQESTPNNSVVHEFLGSALLAENLPEEAAYELQAAIGLAPSYAPLHRDLATALEILSRSDEALAEYRAAEALDPQFVDAINGVARLLIDRGQLEEARRLLDRALALGPEDPVTYANLASLSIRTGDFAAALTYADHGLALNPRLYACDLRAAEALRGLRRYDEALARLERLEELAPGDAMVQQELAQTRAQKQAAAGK